MKYIFVIMERIRMPPHKDRKEQEEIVQDRRAEETMRNKLKWKPNWKTAMWSSRDTSSKEEFPTNNRGNNSQPTLESVSPSFPSVFVFHRDKYRISKETHQP